MRRSYKDSKEQCTKKTVNMRYYIYLHLKAKKQTIVYMTCKFCIFATRITEITGIYHPIDTWRVYSVSGWPCRRGTTCQQHKHAGFWFCELEGGDANSWDYCCSPHHQCGYSEGYPYQWCYVGNDKTQWRTCSDRYYPYYPHHPHTHSKYYLGDKYGSASQGNYITDTGPKFGKLLIYITPKITKMLGG